MAADTDTMAQQKEDASWLARRIAPGILWAMKNPKSAIVTGFVTVSAFWAFFGSSFANLTSAKGNRQGIDSALVLMISMSHKMDRMAVRIDTLSVRVDTIAQTSRDLKGAFNEINGGSAAMRRFKKKEKDAIDFLKGISRPAEIDHTNYVYSRSQKQRSSQ